MFGPAPFIGYARQVTATLTDQNNQSDVSVAAITHSSLSFGAAHSKRLLVAMVYTSGIVVDSATIGGVAATRRAIADSGVGQTVQIWVAAVPTGTSGNVVLTLDSTDSGVTTVFIYNIQFAESAVPTDTATATSTSTTIDIEPLGTAVGIFHRADANHTWTGLVEDAEEVGTNPRQSVAHLDSEAGETGLTVSVSGGANIVILLAVAAFR